MCGIVGLWDPSRKIAEPLEQLILKMASRIRHRGPDDEGSYVDPRTGLALGQRRLSVLDLSAEGHQPMRSSTGRFVISYNGEIYNFRELRKEAESWGAAFRGHSDTEIMLAHFEKSPFESVLAKLEGMFALALWDTRDRILRLARDRVGEKPLYYGLQSGVLAFSSELRPFLEVPSWDVPIDRSSIGELLRTNYIPTPSSIFRGVEKLPQATWIELREENLKPSGKWARPKSYWSLLNVLETESQKPQQSESEHLDNLESALTNSVNQKLIADVPVGLFLSGGIDSSLVTALAQRTHSEPVQTFTIGFDSQSYDEAPYAKKVAEHLGTQHTELYVSAEEAMAVIPKLPSIYDEPFADSSQVPTFLVSQLARQHVTVALSGDAGDELFGGYSRYTHIRDVEAAVARWPEFALKGAAKLMQVPSVGAWNALSKVINPVLPGSLRGGSQLGQKMHKLSQLLSSGHADEVYMQLLTHWKNPEDIVLGYEPRPWLVEEWLKPGSPVSDLESPMRLMQLDFHTYLPDDILVKVDRAAMAVSLETRAPFLDRQVMACAMRLPESLRIQNGKGKIALRKILAKYVPENLFERPKMGFGIPINEWLRGGLKDWAADLLHPDRLKREGFFKPEPIIEKWTALQKGENWGYYLWDILMFQAWYDSFRTQWR